MIRKTAFGSLGLAVLKICITEGNVSIQQDMNKNSRNPAKIQISFLYFLRESLKMSRCDLVGSTSLQGTGTSRFIKVDESKGAGKAK